MRLALFYASWHIPLALGRLSALPTTTLAFWLISHGFSIYLVDSVSQYTTLKILNDFNSARSI